MEIWKLGLFTVNCLDPKKQICPKDQEEKKKLLPDSGWKNNPSAKTVAMLESTSIYELIYA